MGQVDQFFATFRPDQVQAVIAALAFVVGCVSAIIALRSLRMIARSNQLQAFDAFEERWDSMKDVRLEVLEGFVFDANSPPELSSDVGRKLRLVINNINVVGSLLESKMIPAKSVLSLCYPDFIRFERILDPYLLYRSGQLGLDYGRRVNRMAARAKRYHDLRHPEKVVKTRGLDGSYYVIYATPPARTVAVRFLRAIEGSARRLTGLY